MRTDPICPKPGHFEQVTKVTKRAASWPSPTSPRISGGAGCTVQASLERVRPMNRGNRKLFVATFAVRSCLLGTDGQCLLRDPRWLILIPRLEQPYNSCYARVHIHLETRYRAMFMRSMSLGRRFCYTCHAPAWLRLTFPIIAAMDLPCRLLPSK
jgi:hypothetical protein